MQIRTMMPTFLEKFEKWKLNCFSSSNDNWKAIPNYFFDTYGSLPFLFKCDYNTENLDLKHTLYRKFLDYFQELTKYSEENNK